ncbi:nucleotide-diphospho-sugar transferase [Geopyxis carbonaria]|nr:nucleotide-diphospho-sugar transferase [Geopyxis carbonaria]
MSSRKDKKPAAGNKKGEEDQRENILQAVVLTDSYQTRFRPLTLEHPRCLLPLANLPLIEYTLEFLSLAGVEEVFIFASTHSEKIEQYIRNSKWNLESSPFKKCQIVMSPSSMSVGDAMRELDVKGMITTDFLLVNGDFVSNLPLEGVLEAHRKRRTQNKNAIMTMILRESGFEHRSKARGESGAFVIDEATQRCIHYEEMRSHDETAINVPIELFKTNPQLRIRTDLIDCHIDICSPDVPALFTENFDYQHIRRHFLHGILTDHELYGKTIHTHVVKDFYAARVRSLQTYDAVSRDIMARWTYPLVPDSNLGDGQNYTLFRGNIYKEEDVLLERSCKVTRNSILGRDTSIGEGSIIGNSVIGDNCKIGSNVVLDRAYIWDGVEIGNGCKIQNSIVANNVVMGNDCIVEAGSIVSFGVKVTTGTTLKRFSRISSFNNKKDLEDTETGAYSGSEYEPSESESEGEEASAAKDGLVYSNVKFSGSMSSISTLPDEESDFESDSENGHTRIQHTRSNSAASEDADDAWHKEAYNSLFAQITEGIPSEVIALEFNSLRMTANASWFQARKALVAALISRIEKIAAAEGMNNQKATNQVLLRWKELISRSLHELSDKVEILVIVQRECTSRKSGESLLLNFVQNLYDPLDLIEEEVVNKWWADPRSVENEKMIAVRLPTQAFVNWLAEAESEESEEESEEEEESDDDE